MAQPTPAEANGASTPVNDEIEHVAIPGKRKRDSEDDEGADEMTGVEEQKPTAPHRWAAGEQKDLIKSYFDVLKSIDIEPAILKRPFQDRQTESEPDTKRHKSSEPPSLKSISDKIAADAYSHVEDVASDVVSVADSALSEIRAKAPDGSGSVENTKAIVRITEFKAQAAALLERERAYPQAVKPEALDGICDSSSASRKSRAILSVVGYAPQERRLFSSLPLSQDIDLTEYNLPPSVSFSRVVPSNSQERTQTLGELFGSPRPLPPLQPPTQPKTQAKGNILDFYQPELAFANDGPSCYFNSKASSGCYLDYSNATPSYQTMTKQRERAQSLAGKKPSTSELEMSEMESLFRGAFSSFAPCKDDSGAVISSGSAGKVWWQKNGSKSFQRMVEVEYYPDIADVDAFHREIKSEELDEMAIQEAIDAWDNDAVDPSLEDALGTKRDDGEKEVDEILDEVSSLIETLASYQRIRNLTLPNSQNRQSSDPVNGDMLANSGPQPSEDEQATYDMLKAQLVLIITTLPPYAVAKLNGDQLDDLLISTKVQVQTDQYRGVMEDDDAGVQARIRAQQQAAAQASQAAQVPARPPSQRAASISTPYANQYQHAPQYATPTRTPSHPQQYFRSMPQPNYQQARPVGSPAAQQHRPPQPNQYTRPNGYPNQYATQLAKAQTPYGHQNMPQYANQQRPPQYGQLQQQGTPNTARFQYQPGYQQQQQPPAGVPGQPNYAVYTNGGAGMPPRNMSPQVPQRHAYSPSPNIQQPPRYGTPGQGNPQMARHASYPGQHPQYNQSPGLTGYHTVIPEAQQQRILEQAKARVAAQERTAMFGDKMSQPGYAGMGMGYGGNVDANRVAAARANIMNQQKPQTPVSQRPGMNGTPQSQYVPPAKVTPVPVPPIPGAGQHQPSPQPQPQPQQQQQQLQQPVPNAEAQM